MTTDLHIDRALAMAIGHEQPHVAAARSAAMVLAPDPDRPERWCWRRFSHKDPAVIWPIAERFDCFPFKSTTAPIVWCAGLGDTEISRLQYHVNPCAAVALAVIAAHGGGM